MSGDARLPIADVLGTSSWAFRTTSGLNDEELLGVLTVRTELCRQEVVASYVGSDEDDD